MLVGTNIQMGRLCILGIKKNQLEFMLFFFFFKLGEKLLSLIFFFCLFLQHIVFKIKD